MITRPSRQARAGKEMPQAPSWPSEPTCLRVRAPAKLNLWLLVGRRRPSGYHEIRSLVAPITLADEVEVWYKPDRASRRPDEVPATDLAVRALEWWREHVGPVDGEVEVRIRKNIPVGAGLGGGSADAAAVLRALCWLSGLDSAHLDTRTLCSLGCDVPVCLLGRPAVVGGIGEAVSPAPTPRWRGVCVLWPGVSISTARAYAWLDEDGGARRLLDWTPEPGHNDFWPVVVRRHPELRQWRTRLAQTGAEVVGMSGSGSALFGLFTRLEDARRAAQALRRSTSSVWACSILDETQPSERCA